MGYITYYTLNKIQGSDEDYEALVKDIEEKTGIDFSRDNCQEAKWYDNHKDMTALTEKYPDLTVQLDGDGEDSDDVWACRYRGGRSEQVGFECGSFCDLATPTELQSLLTKTYADARKNFIRLIRRIVRDRNGKTDTDIVLKEDTVSVSRCTHLEDGTDGLRFDHSIEMKADGSRLGSWRDADTGMTLQEAFVIAQALLKDEYGK